MSGAHATWTEERRAAYAARMKARWRDPSYRARQVAERRSRSPSDEQRAAASACMKRLNARMRDEEKLKAKCVRGQRRARRRPAARAIQAAVMTELMSRPESRRRARYHAIKINKDPKVRRRQWAGRRRKKKAAQQ